MKHITRKKVEKIIEYCYFKNLSCRGTAKLLKISKTTANDYYHKFLSANLKYADLIIQPDKVFNKIFFKKNQNSKATKRITEIYKIFPDIFENNSNQTHIDYWKIHKKLVNNPYEYTQFCYYLNDWLEQNKFTITYNLLPLKELTAQDFKLLKKYKKSKDKNQWRKAKAIIDIHKGKSKVKVANNIEMSIKTLKRWINTVNNKGLEALFKKSTQRLH